MLLRLLTRQPLAAACLASASLSVAYGRSLTTVAMQQQPAAAASGAAVVVGVSHKPGLGFAVAKRFAEGGMPVGIVGRQQDKLDECRMAILAEYPTANVIAVRADCTDEEQVADAFAKLKKAHGPPEALIYNLSARPFPPTKIGDVTPTRLESDWKTGPYGALLCVHQVLPEMQAQQKGTIIFTGASASLRGTARFGSFAVAKNGLRAFAQSLAKECLPEGIHVAHVVVDAMVDMPVIRGFVPKDIDPGRLLDPEACAEHYWHLHTQDKRCFTFESDVRPLLMQWS